MQKNDLLQVNELAVAFQTYRGQVQAVRNVSLSVKEGEIVGIVGESGCGKSVTAHAIMGLLPEENAKITHGVINFQGKNLLSMQQREWRQLRGNDIAMIFQDPMTSLNPVHTIGAQLGESILRHRPGLTRKQLQAEAVRLLAQVGISEPVKRLQAYPHQFSGGMRQRVMIAMALAGEPKLLIADEPTTALDVTIQAQILALLQQLRRELGMSIILISHDLGVIAGTCDFVNVMYAGEIVESGPVRDIFHQPQHPYTQGLLRSLPRLTDNRQEKLAVIDGQPPDLLLPIEGCGFLPRCREAMQVCQSRHPSAMSLDNAGHRTRCWLLAKALQAKTEKKGAAAYE